MSCRMSPLRFAILIVVVVPLAGSEWAAADDPLPPAAEARRLSSEEIAAGWISLFDGETLFGWQANNDPESGGVNWSVRDGVIAADRGEQGLLVTTVPFADYELRCDYRLAEGGNSGIFLRTTFRPIDAARDCYELNMCDSHPEFPTGSLVGRRKIGTELDGEGAWKTFHVRCEGPRIAVRFEGREVLDFTDDTPALRLAGSIGLQKNVGRIEFRNVFLRPLGTRAIFTGKDLSGWREVPGSKSEFKVVDGVIHVTRGPGFLETTGTWSDLVLQGEARTNGKHLNSGIFFRAMPGTEAAPSNGYEFQIHNGFRDGDRTKPVDAGTGAIFRRQAARRVVGNDGEWVALTLVAHGPRIATWVNGYQVCDWEDDRPPDENPRRGRRLEAGHISLQGHDPTTDLDFRKLRVAAFPPSGD
ncbi:MAG TPA: DUF1080 domain-containing protein [Planctomycetaceae bacterium]|nr:DUF1080 domain-containing protein [Planctomycetaceae bacterium]